MDKVSPEQRSENMRRIRGRNTAPEIAVRRFLHARGLRYRLHAKKLPGKPDLVFSGRRACVFVHGCFWHGCPNCVDGTREVRSNRPYWKSKIEGNRLRDKRNVANLEADGWTVFVIWECEVRQVDRLEDLADRLLALPVRRKG